MLVEDRAISEMRVLRVGEVNGGDPIFSCLEDEECPVAREDVIN